MPLLTLLRLATAAVRRLVGAIAALREVHKRIKAARTSWSVSKEPRSRCPSLLPAPAHGLHSTPLHMAAVHGSSAMALARAVQPAAATPSAAAPCGGRAAASGSEQQPASGARARPIV